MKKTSEELMSLAIAEASKAEYLTKPNPRVGAAIETQSGEILSAFHQRAGFPHAEIELLKKCAQQGVSTQGSSMAITLEPCCHTGRTGPCVDALISAGVKRVFIGTRDPNPKVNGVGIVKLMEAGVEVEESILAKECIELNREWLIAKKLVRPFVTLKMATSFDGRWRSDQGESKWITGESARSRVHELRSKVDAIITSYPTIESDNPLMTARPSKTVNFIPPKVFIFSRGQRKNLDSYKISKVNPLHVDTAIGLHTALIKLYTEFEVNHTMIEAGPVLATSFLNEHLVDEIWHFQAPILLGGNNNGLGPFNNGHLPGLKLKHLRQEKCDQDFLNIYTCLSDTF